MTPKLLSRLPVIKWVSILVLIVMVVGGSWFVSRYLYPEYESFWFFLKENIGQISAYALLVVIVLYASFTFIEVLVEKNVRINLRLEEVYRITRQAQEEESGDKLLQHAMRVVSEVFEFDRAVLFMASDSVPDETPGRLRARAWTGIPAEDASRASLDLTRRLPIAESVQSGAPRIFENTGEVAFEREVMLGAGTDASLKRFSVIPMRQEGRTTGVLYADRSRPHAGRDRIDADELRLLATYMDQVSVVLQRLRLLEREKELSRTLTHKVEEAVARERGLEEKLRLSETLAALGEMAASLTHEIKNPLGGLDMYARLLQRDLTSPAGSSDAEKRDLIGKIIDGIKALNTIVGNLLGYARVAMGEMNDRICVDDVITAAADFARPEMQRVRVTFQYEKPHTTLFVMGNFDQLRQVFLNLLLNGVQSMNETGGTLTVRVLRKPAPSTVPDLREWVVTEISDTGVGMTDEQKGRIFEDFYTTREKGTGLGLAISRKIVKVHGGEITFESEWKKGSTFRVYMPEAPQGAVAS